MNLINAGLLARSAYLAHNIELRNALLSYVLFEIMHVLSHAVHLNRNFHEIGIHVCVYLMSFTTHCILKLETDYVLPTSRKLYIAATSVVDLIVFIRVRNIYSIATGLSLLAVTVMQYFDRKI